MILSFSRKSKGKPTLFVGKVLNGLISNGLITEKQLFDLLKNRKDLI